MNQRELDGWRESPRYPLLYNSKNGKTRVWGCWVQGDTIYRTDGFVDGKLKEPLPRVFKGNTLRTGAEQAPLEAEKMWLKQIDRDYLPAKDDKAGNRIFEHVKRQKEQNGGMNRGVRMFGDTDISTKTTAGAKAFGSQHRPMLAKKYKDWRNETFCLTPVGGAIQFPALAQAKVDGIRALPHIQGDDVMLESRNGNSFVHLNHVRDEIRRWLEHKGRPEIILDGELYVHRLYRDADGAPSTDVRGREMKGVERYQYVSEACKVTRTNPHTHEHLIEYWVFDIWDPTMPNMERWELVDELFKDYDGKIIRLVPTRVVDSHSEIEDFMSELVGETTNREGYEFEGLMVRRGDAKYVASTTHQSCLLKYKRFQDEEWEVCGAERCDGGTQDGAIKWLCRKEINGKEKKLVAKQIGDAEESKKLYKAYTKSPKRFHGRMINIRFNDRTRDGVPRFPRATAFVEDK